MLVSLQFVFFLISSYVTNVYTLTAITNAYFKPEFVLILLIHVVHSQAYLTINDKNTLTTQLISWCTPASRPTVEANYGNPSIWDITRVTDLSAIFGTVPNTNVDSCNPPIANWNTAKVTNMNNMFSLAIAFNQPIGNWNTAKVTNMGSFFYKVTNFNQPIDMWNTSAVTDMRLMFSLTKFNQPIGNWDTAKVTRMDNMFASASVFNQYIGNWNTAKVTTMRSMFSNTLMFNQEIGNWNTGAVNDMGFMFSSSNVFNQSIGNWNTSAVTTMTEMFYKAYEFNQPIGKWNTAAVTDMGRMFSFARAFDQPIGNWNTAAVTFMRNMFDSSTSFNQQIGNWNTAAVTQMQYMFNASIAFNQYLWWNTAKVTNMDYMFKGASSFNQRLCFNPKPAAVSVFTGSLGSWAPTPCTNSPTSFITQSPTTSQPTTQPSTIPTLSPTIKPTLYPTYAPTKAPTKSPTKTPTKAPTEAPTTQPTRRPNDNGWLPSVYRKRSALNYSGASECNNRFSLMDKVQIVHELEFKWVSSMVMETTVSENAMLGDLRMVRNQNILCGAVQQLDMYSYQNCTITYLSTNCIPISINLNNTCAFDIQFDMFTQANLTMFFPQDGNVHNTTLSLQSNPVLLYSGPCNNNTSIIDVSSVTPVVINSYSQGRESMIELSMVNTSASSSIAIAIVEVRVNATDSLGRLFSQTYDIWDKIRLMQVPGSPYYSDVHFCRFIDSFSCSPFYLKLKNNTMRDPYSIVDSTSTVVNAYNINSTPYLVHNKGYEKCPDIHERNVDRWTFNPSLWPFRGMKQTGTITATLHVTALLSNCSTSSYRDLSSNTDHPSIVRSSVMLNLILDDASSGCSLSLVLVVSIVIFVQNMF